MFLRRSFSSPSPKITNEMGAQHSLCVGVWVCGCVGVWVCCVCCELRTGAGQGRGRAVPGASQGTRSHWPPRWLRASQRGAASSCGCFWKGQESEIQSLRKQGATVKSLGSFNFKSPKLMVLQRLFMVARVSWCFGSTCAEPLKAGTDQLLGVSWACYSQSRRGVCIFG